MRRKAKKTIHFTKKYYICHMFKLILLCDYTREPERRLLRGLSDFANNHGVWSFYHIPKTVYNDPSRSPEIVEKAKAIGADAIFGRWNGVNNTLTDSLAIPIVLRSGPVDYPNYPMLSGDYERMGEMAAEFFYKKHYLNYAFYGYSGLTWSDLRRSGYERFLSNKNMTAHSLMTDISKPDEDELKRWLVGLPKPIALLCANDVLAAIVAEICQENNIRIPEELSLLGIDNDEFLCNIAYPSISSIHLDFERQGYELGEAIYSMHEKQQITLVRIPVHPIGIIERNSTLRHNIKDPHIRQIVDFIDTYYDTPISIKDIVKDIPLSRRAIELRFKKEMAPETILSYLYRQRVRKMCHLLSSSDMPISIAAEKSGFTDVFNVGRTFKHFTGVSPAQYRKNNKTTLSRTADNNHSGDKKG